MSDLVTLLTPVALGLALKLYIIQLRLASFRLVLESLDRTLQKVVVFFSRKDRRKTARAIYRRSLWLKVVAGFNQATSD